MKKLGDAAHNLPVRTVVNAAELVEIKHHAVERGLTVSAYLRAAALGRVGRRVPRIEAVDRLSVANRLCGEAAGQATPQVRQKIVAVQVELAALLKLALIG